MVHCTGSCSKLQEHLKPFELDLLRPEVTCFGIDTGDSSEERRHLVDSNFDRGVLFPMSLLEDRDLRGQLMGGRGTIEVSSSNKHHTHNVIGIGRSTEPVSSMFG